MNPIFESEVIKKLIMTNKEKRLADYFPMLRSREDVLSEIHASRSMTTTFNAWNEQEQERFLDMCTGNRGVKMLYDSYFKEILNPESDPERLSDLLSSLMQRKVTVKHVLPNDSNRLGDELSLVITDIVVELDDGSIANVEVQKMGYRFPGQRASCYSADLLLRQYKRLRDESKKDFLYRDICPVYTIVFMDESIDAFKKYPDTYVHKFSTISDSGIELEMLQYYFFIPVDIFLTKLHNEGIKNKLDAWLTFLGCDEPEYILKLVEKYDQFKKYYDDLYEMCLNTEEVMSMYSKELAEIDRNTVRFMIDESQEEAKRARAEADAVKAKLDAVLKYCKEHNIELPTGEE